MLLMKSEPGNYAHDGHKRRQEQIRSRIIGNNGCANHMKDICGGLFIVQR